MVQACKDHTVMRHACQQLPLLRCMCACRSEEPAAQPPNDQPLRTSSPLGKVCPPSLIMRKPWRCSHTPQQNAVLYEHANRCVYLMTARACTTAKHGDGVCQHTRVPHDSTCVHHSKRWCCVCQQVRVPHDSTCVHHG